MADRPERKITPVGTIGLLLAMLAAVAGGAAGLGYRLGWWPLGTAFGVLRYAAYGGLLAAAVSLLGALLARPGGRWRGFFRSIAGLMIGAAVFGVPWSYFRVAQQVPPIHDITTDTADPPKFVAILPLRAGAANPEDYGGEEVAAQQRAAYPTIQPAETSVPPEQTFDLALATAEDQGWDVVATAPSEGRIEATDTTLWFGFTDDVVIRVRPEGSGSRLDIRSTSRIGLGDAGTNAARVESFLEELKSRLEGAE